MWLKNQSFNQSQDLSHNMLESNLSLSLLLKLFSKHKQQVSLKKLGRTKNNRTFCKWYFITSQTLTKKLVNPEITIADYYYIHLLLLLTCQYCLISMYSSPWVDHTFLLPVKETQKCLMTWLVSTLGEHMGTHLFIIRIILSQHSDSILYCMVYDVLHLQSRIKKKCH